MNRGSLLLCVVATFAGCTGPDSRETPTEKAEWATLQAAEFGNRSTPMNEPSLRTVHGREVLGLRGLDGQNIWILLLRHERPRAAAELPR
jgi:hypothetical protein